MKRIAVLALVMWAAALTGCNTVEGMGKDLKKAGEKLEKSAK